MDKFIVKGGSLLKGEVKISGSKNAALPILASTILAKGNHIISNSPEVKDVLTMRNLLSYMGATTSDGDKIKINFDHLERPEAPYELVKTMRASSMVLGPLLARTGYAKVSLPGGCTIGERPLNLHIDALRSMGAKIKLEQGYIEARAKKLKGTEIYFDNLTVTGTENIMMAATLAEGTTVIENAAKEPEIVDLANYLIKMGAKIDGAGTHQIEIKGVNSLTASKHSIIPDRIEAGTFMIAAAMCGEDVKIKNLVPSHLDSLTEKLRIVGADVRLNSDTVRIKRATRINPTNINTLPYPGFATDLQAQFMTLLCRSDGSAIVTETIFENRFQHVAELKRMGANITIEGSSAFIKGVKKLRGAPVMATDLRASASLILAAIVAEGMTEINRIYHIDRGYEQIESKFNSLGAAINRIPS